jgi:hypothetical protein
MLLCRRCLRPHMEASRFATVDFKIRAAWPDLGAFSIRGSVSMITSIEGRKMRLFPLRSGTLPNKGEYCALDWLKLFWRG